MNQRTFEIVGKWIGHAVGATVKFEDGATPSASIETNCITLPSNLKDENCSTALSLIMHEGAHLRYTKKVPTMQICRDQEDFGILNAVEDARIDRKNFSLLPNVMDFYDDMYQHYSKKKADIDPAKLPLHTRALSNGILELENFDQYGWKDNETRDMVRSKDVVNKMWDISNCLDRCKWDEAKDRIHALRKDLGVDEPTPESMQDFQNNAKSGVGMQGDEQGSGKGGEGDEQIGLLPQQRSTAGKQALMSGSGGSKGCGDGDGCGSSVISEVVLQERTKAKFKEMLCVKEIKKVQDGMTLETDNITDFFTGEVEPLFSSDKIVKKKKSKISILLDSSSSMTDHLYDGTCRNSTVAGCVKQIIDILTELEVIHGVDIRWDIAAFDYTLHPLDKSDWERQYLSRGGGTSLLNAFAEAQEKLVKDQELDGKRLILVLTDGDVGCSEIDEMKELIIKHNSDVRCMVIGVGSNVTGSFVKNIVGDNNILAKEQSDIILLEAIMTMLD